MAVLLSCREIKKDFGDKNILKNISFDIAEGERIGVVGLNGAGKTTLANIISGSIEPDEGTLGWHKKSVNIGCLRQESSYSGTFAEEGNVKDCLHSSSLMGLKNVSHWEESRFDNLSGGEKTKLSLSKVWSANPDFLILDEPTNHLDYKGVSWLIKEMEKYKGTVLVISHDRYFLDNCVTRIIEIEKGTAQSYNGNYSFYREEKKRRYDSQLNQYLLQVEMKRKINEQIDNLRSWSAKAHKEAPTKAAASGNKKGGKEFLRAKAKKMDIQIKSRIKRLEKIQIEGIEKPQEESKVTFAAKRATLKGSRILEAASISKGFKGKSLFEDTSFYIQRGDRVGIWGENGCGKTTLLKLLIGLDEADKGEIFLSSSARIGYLSQDISEIQMNQRVLDFFHTASREEMGELRTLLFNMGFREDMLKQTASSLSLGELTRLRLAELIRKECDLLILDEPMNHLDLHSREKLEEVLLGYNGTIILVSHDRYMMERICSKLLLFENNRVLRGEYGLKEHLERNLGKKKSSESRLVLENEISWVLGELCRNTAGTEEYVKLDLRFKALIKRKRELEAQA